MKPLTSKPYQIREIQEIKEMMEADESTPGAYRCTYFTFVDVFHMIQRQLERSRQKGSLIVCTIEGEEEQTERKRQMDEFEGLLKILRRSDVYARCSADQILLLLIGNDIEQTKVVTAKLEQAWGNRKEKKQKLKFSIYPLENGEIGEAC